MFKKVTSSADSPYLYKKSKTKGITIRYANTQPVIKRPIVGIVIDLLT